MAITYNNIGNVFNILGKYSQALPILQKALAISTNLKDQLGLARVYNNLARAHRGLNQYEKAASFLKETLDIWLRLENYQKVLDT
jgi:tetratricopeptide (TPR) repeat protein